MKKENDEYLCKTYPKLFADRHGAVTATAMCWGFEHGDGWYNIIEALCSNIQHHIDWKLQCHKRDIEYNSMIAAAQAGNIAQLEDYYKGYINAEEMMTRALEKGFRDVTPEVEQVVVEQVKEKFGTLRFYYRGGDDYVRGLVSMAEAMSGRTCESCGNPAKTGGEGWIRTICPTCEEAREKAYLKQSYEG